MNNFAMACAMKKRSKKMSKGGQVDEEDDLDLNQHGEEESGPEDDMVHRVVKNFAAGGMIDEEDEGSSNMGGFMSSHPEYGGSEAPSDVEETINHDFDNADSVMHKAAGGLIDNIMRKHYSKGGQVSNDVGVAEADKMPAEYDDLVLRDDDMEDADYTGANSGDELGDEGEDMRRKDMVSRIMKSRSKRDRMPRPA